MSTAFAPRSSMAASTGPGTMPTTPRGGYSATGTPRSARRLLGANTPSSRASFAPSSSFASGLPPSGGAAPVLAPLPPINARAYPDRPYADDDELRSVMDADRDAVDTACALLGAALAQQRKAVLEALEEIGAEKRRLDKMTRELGDAAREMVRTVQREKDELDRARELEGEVTARGRALAVQVETAQAEVKEVLAKLAARRERASTFLRLSRALARGTLTADTLAPSQGETARCFRDPRLTQRSRACLLRAQAGPQDPRPCACVPISSVSRSSSTDSDERDEGTRRRRRPVQVPAHRPGFARAHLLLRPRRLAADLLACVFLSPRTLLSSPASPDPRASAQSPPPSPPPSSLPRSRPRSSPSSTPRATCTPLCAPSAARSSMR